MFAKIKLKYNDDGIPNPLTHQRRTRSIPARTLAISSTVFILLLISIIYHGIVLEQFGELKQFVKLSQKCEKLNRASDIELEIDSSKSVIEIPDSELVTEDGNSIIEGNYATKNDEYNDELQSLKIQHGKIKFSRRRLSRDLIDPLDPLALHYDLDIMKLKSRVRDKRTKIALSKLERDYVRCKKDSSRYNDCLTEFSKLYKVVKELNEMLKDSELVLQLNSKSDETPSNETNKSDDHDDEIQQNITQKHTTEHPSDEKLTTILSVKSTTPSTPSTTATLTTTTTTPKSHKIKPLKISWIIDGFDDVDEEINNSNSSSSTTTTIKTTTTMITDPITTSKVVLANTEKLMTTVTTESAELIAEIDDFEESTTHQYHNIDATLLSKPESLNHKTTLQPTTSNAHRNESITMTPSTMSSIASTIDVEQEKLRKLKFDWLVGKANFSTEEQVGDTGCSTSSFKILTDLTNSAESTPNWTSSVEEATSSLGLTTESHQRSQNTIHPLDYPTSLENMLGSFEQSDLLKPLVHDSSTNETDLYDPTIWTKKFQEAAAIRPQGELLDTFDDNEMGNVNRMGPKLNPVNMKSLSADDAQLLSLCDRMTKRLRNKAIANNAADLDSDGLIQTSPNTQFTSRGPGGFPVTGESIKATAQFMFNPSFGMPSIPICFYLTPANFRMPSQIMPSWQSPFYGMPSFYGAPSGNVMGSGIGPGNVYFMPQNFGSTGNLFSGSGAGNSQSSGQNIFPKTVTSEKQQPQQFYCTYMQNNSNQGIPSNIGSSHALSSTGFLRSNFKLHTANQTSSPLDIIYASFTDVPTSHLDHKTQMKCELPDHVACYGGNECIRQSSWCDSIVDCSDGSDEAACTCQDRLASNRLCDGYPDCPMGEDEIGCFGCENYMYSCYANAQEYERFNRSTISMCYNILDRCDGIENCLNGQDERECNIIVKDLTHHMSHSVSSSEGFLYHNHRGEWYPVCNNAEKWAKDACKSEGGYMSAPNITFHEISLSGPFIEPLQLVNVHFPHSCQKRKGVDAIADHSTYVKCAPSKCGSRKKNAETSLRPQSKRRLSKRKKRIISRQEEDEVDDEEVDIQAKDSERIVGGKYSKPLEWPFVVAIYRNGNFHCAGTIYNERWIISAAHCAINYQKYHYEVRAGLLRRTSYSATTQIQPVSHIVVHQYYERLSMRNDLSLMRLIEPLRFNRWVKPICLPDIGRTTNGKDWIWGPEAGALCTVVGWGAIREKGSGSDQLREVVIPIRKRCKDRPDQESESICAGDIDGGRDACQGDSGGPLFCSSVTNSDEFYLAGVVSHGNGCARSGEFGVYTRVALYLDWIEMAVKPELLPKKQPAQECPGYVCVWGGKRCIPQKKRCNRVADCLGGEDEVGCVYNFIPDLGNALNSTTTESDYYPIAESTTEQMQIQEMEIAATNIETTTQLPIETKTELTIETKTQLPIETITLPPIETTTMSPIETTTMPPIETTIMPPIETTTTLPTTFSKEILEIETQITFIKSTTNSIVEESTLETIGTTDSPRDQTTEGLEDLTEAVNTTSNVEVEENISTIAMEEDTSTSKTFATIPTTTMASVDTTKVPAVKATSTLPEKFICRKIAQIIELKHRCDRLVDCEDGTDEENCNCRDYLKDSLSILVCDGKTDCEDGSDEKNCGHCKVDEFLCPLSKSCIPLAKRCDNIGDCQFKEDEKDCFALTNGKDLHQDINKRPVFRSFGIFTRNTNGQWHIVCAHETSFEEHNAKTVAEICTLLGFKGYNFYNTTSISTTVPRDSIIVPIDPDNAKQPRIKAHLAAAVEDNFHYSSNENIFAFQPFESTKKLENIERIQGGSHGICIGIYAECNAASDTTQPQKTLTAGSMLAPNAADTPKLKPLLKTYLRPNVYVKPEMPTQLLNKEDEVLDKLDPSYATKKNMSILANNELHEAVEELHWPWLVDIYANGKLWCAGVLLDKYWVMVHESCYFGVRLNTDYVSALFGGGKTKNMPHKSPNEQIIRIDCFQSVPKSDIILYHLERPVHFSRHILPIFLPERDTFDDSDQRECMAILHDELTGLIKTVPIIEHKDNETCQTSQMACYRLMENTELMKITLDIITDSRIRQANSTSDGILNALSKMTTCSQFGLKTFRNAIEPIDQGILVCRDANDGWFPAALFSYNNTDCRSFKQPFGIRTLEKLYDTIQIMIDQPKCSITHSEPICDTFRCPLGKCLSSEEICNNKNDCHDGSDEDALFCLEYKRGCEPWEMQCRSSKKCIPKSKFCDHVPDCEDFTDEPTICSCFTYLKATDPGKICDGIRNCWDKSDESPVLCNCTAELFSCGNKPRECIPQDFVCDKEPDCPNGEDERYCFGIEQPQLHPKHKNDPDHVDPLRPPKYGQVIEQTYGVWHTKCFPRSSPPDISEVRRICRKLGYTPYRQPSYRLIDDVASEVFETNEQEPDKRGRTIGNATTLTDKYRYSTKAIVVSKFSPIMLNDELTIFLKPSRPIAELVRWNATDSSRCFRLEIRCG